MYFGKEDMPLFDPLPSEDSDDKDVIGCDKPQTKAEISKKLHAAVPKAIRALEQAMTFGEYGEMIRAAQIILDRAGYGPKSTVVVEELPDDLSNLSDTEI